MRKNLLYSSLLIIAFVFTSKFINAQENFKEAYIITLDNDTVYGQVDYRNYEYLSQKCTFKSKQGEVSQYLPGSIKSFRFINGKYYVSKSIEGENFFLEYIIDGEVDLYFRRKEGKDYFYMQKEGERLVELPKKEMVYTADGRQVYERKYVGVLNYYMGDAPKLKYRIQNFEDIDHKNLTKLAKDYHNYVCEDGECIVFEEKKKGFNVHIEILTGGLKFTKFMNEDKVIMNEDKVIKYEDLYMQTGVIAHFWLPRANEKLYLRTGFQYLRVDPNDKEVNALKIPIHLEYIYPKGFVRPKISYGINGYIGKGFFTTALNGGLDFVLTDKIRLGITSDVDFASFLIPLIRQTISYTINAGLSVELNSKKNK